VLYELRDERGVVLDTSGRSTDAQLWPLFAVLGGRGMQEEISKIRRHNA